jgi:hypothetical protein
MPPENKSQFRACALTLDIAHPTGLHMGGFGSRESAFSSIHDTPQTRMLLLEKGETRILWISCDLLGLSRTTDDTLRTLAGAAVDIPADQVVVSCTHSHAAAASIPLRGHVSIVDQEWLNVQIGEFAEAAGRLPNQLRPAKLGYAKDTLRGIAYNRDDIDGPVDETLLVSRIEAADGELIASIVNYALHPVALGPGNLQISGEFCGLASRIVEESEGGVCLFIQSACGDIDPILMKTGSGRATFEEVQGLAETFSTATRNLLSSIACSSDVELSIESELVAVSMDPPADFSALRAEKAELVKNSSRDTISWVGPQLEWIVALEKALARRAVPDHLSIRITALQLGALRVVAMPFEPYTQLGIELRNGTSGDLMIAAYSNGLVGYLPTREAKERGGYGATRAHRFFPESLTPISGDAGETLVAKATQMLKRLGSERIPTH